MADIMPASNYNKLSENLRRVTPNSIQCSIFCGGRRCKYENPDNLDAVHMAVDGLFSHWVTDDILATARPSTELINNKNLIDQFKSLGIKSLINLQLPGEHASCGPPLEPSGFTYCPGTFMENNIYFYNFGWRDYGEAKIHRLLDMVKVMAFALEEGKVAVHCHAGLGRTGVLIACYLVFSLRVRANEAIRYVRLKRPNSVQTRGQILCVQEFEQFVLPQSTVFCNKDLAKDKKVQDFSLKQFLTRQAVTTHGYEARMLKYIPKIVFVICERLLQLCHCQHVACLHKGTKHFIVYHINPDSRIKFSHCGSASTESADSSLRSMFASTTSTMTDFDHDVSQCTSPEMPSCSSGMSGLDDSCLQKILEDEIHADDLHENTCFQELSSTTDLKRISQEENIIHIEASEVARALCSDHQVVDEDTTKCIRNFKLDLSNKASAWARLRIERNVHVLAALLYDWLEHLRTPVLEQEDLSYIVIYGNKPQECLHKLDRGTKYTIEYILRFICHLRPVEHEVHINTMKRFVASLTHQTVVVNDVLQPSGKGFNKLRGGTLKAVMNFLTSFFDMIKDTAESPEKISPADNNKEIISLDIDEV